VSFLTSSGSELWSFKTSGNLDKFGFTAFANSAAPQIPPEFGHLTEPSVKGLNGPSGRALDELYLRPLGIDRNETWLCDMLPESRVNPQQKKVIKTHYLPFALQQKLPSSTIPKFNAAELDSEKRRVGILNELKQSQADMLILLGDLPIKWFLKYYVD
jgi:hypothetical protein